MSTTEEDTWGFSFSKIKADTRPMWKGRQPSGKNIKFCWLLFLMNNYKAWIDELVTKSEELDKIRGENNWVTTKRGKIVRKSDFAPEDFQVGKKYIARGKFYSNESLNGRRTIFRKEPIVINSEKYYLELKGYGRDGKELFFQEYVDGDVYYGMCLDLAIKDFERAKIATKLNLPAVLPLAVIEIPRNEYLRKGLVGFRESVSSAFRSIDIGKLEILVGEVNVRNPEAIADALVDYILRKYSGNLERGIELVLPQLDTGDTQFSLKDTAKALLSKREVGYVARASKCPIRVGQQSDESIGTPENREIAKKMGYAFRTLLENGYLHHCPGTGNWTAAGELTDFADTFDLRTERYKLGEHMKKVGKADAREFLKYLIGPNHTGVLCPDFIEGMHGEKMSLDDAVERVLKYF